MTDKNENSDATPDTPEEEARVPKRVIGTPDSSGAPILLPLDEPEPEGTGKVLDEDHARNAERVAALFFVLAFVGGIAFIIFYAVWPGHVGDIHRATRSNYTLGISLTLALLGLAAGLTIWVRHLVTTPEIVQERHVLDSSPEDRKVFNQYLVEGTKESAIGQRRLLRRTLLLAAAPLGLLPIILLRDMGPLPGKKLRHTVWKSGTRLVVEGTGRPLKPSDFNSPGGIITVIPEGIEDNLEALATSTVLLINLPQDAIKIKKGRENWNVGGIVAYSKICTHVGCPAALYEQTTHHILCPCHQSTFDALDSARVIFGPAARPLPQLPIGVDAEGYLVAKSDFLEPVGPSFWERGNPKV